MGGRAIGIMGAVHRLQVRGIRSQSTDGDIGAGGFWDGALNNHSALRAWLLRALDCEVASLMHRDCFQLLWD